MSFEKLLHCIHHSSHERNCPQLLCQALTQVQFTTDDWAILDFRLAHGFSVPGQHQRRYQFNFHTLSLMDLTSKWSVKKHHLMVFWSASYALLSFLPCCSKEWQDGKMSSDWWTSRVFSLHRSVTTITESSYERCPHSWSGSHSSINRSWAIPHLFPSSTHFEALNRSTIGQLCCSQLEC